MYNAQFTLHDLARRKEDKRHAELRAQGRKERDAAGDYFWTVRHELGRSFSWADEWSREPVPLDLAEPPEKDLKTGTCTDHPESWHPTKVQQVLDDRGKWFYVEREGHYVEKLGFPARKCLSTQLGDRSAINKARPRWISAGGF